MSEEATVQDLVEGKFNSSVVADKLGLSLDRVQQLREAFVAAGRAAVAQDAVAIDPSTFEGTFEPVAASTRTGLPEDQVKALRARFVFAGRAAIDKPSLAPDALHLLAGTFSACKVPRKERSRAKSLRSRFVEAGKAGLEYPGEVEHEPGSRYLIHVVLLLLLLGTVALVVVWWLRFDFKWQTTGLLGDSFAPITGGITAAALILTWRSIQLQRHDLALQRAGHRQQLKEMTDSREAFNEQARAQRELVQAQILSASLAANTALLARLGREIRDHEQKTADARSQINTPYEEALESYRQCREDLQHQLDTARRLLSVPRT